MRPLIIMFLGAAMGPAFSQQATQPPDAGCESREIRAGKEKGKQERFFPMPVAQVKEAVSNALAGLEFEVKKDKGNRFEANKRRHLGVFVGSGGEKMVVEFQPIEREGKQGTLVVAETKKSMMGRAGQKSWAAAVLDQTECSLRGGKS